MSIENNSPDFVGGYFIGEVLEIDRLARRLSVYIPKFMPGIPGNQQVSSSIITTTNPNISGVNYNTTVRVRNSFWVNPWDFDEPLPKIGSKVAVFFLEGNPKSGYWDKFNPNSGYEVIDEEKYPELFRLKIGDREIVAKSEDVISIVFPESFSTIYNEEEKNKEVRLIRQENYVISSEEPANPFPGLVWLNSESEELYVYSGTGFKRIPVEGDTLDGGTY